MTNHTPFSNLTRAFTADHRSKIDKLKTQLIEDMMTNKKSAKI